MAISYKKTVRVPMNGLKDESGPPVDLRINDRQNRVDTILIPESALHRRVSALGREIAETFADMEEITMLVVLKGAFVFAADLGRAIYEAGGPAVTYDFIRASTYGGDLKGAGETARKVKISALTADVKDRDILLVDDIIDQGLTLYHLRRQLIHKLGARSVSICTLLDKLLDDPPTEVTELRSRFNVDFTGFEVPDVWVAGYGVDAGEDFRFLPCIISVDEDFYRWRT